MLTRETLKMPHVPESEHFEGQLMGEETHAPPMALDHVQLRDLVYLAKKVLWNGKHMHRKLQSAGIHISPANFYASIPSVDDVEQSFEYRKDQLERGGPYSTGNIFQRHRIEAFLASIEIYADEFDPPVEGNLHAPAGYFWKNPAFSYLDAMAYYCTLRALRPERVVEIGSGFSTLVADRALRENDHGEITVIEPYPKAFLHQLSRVSRVIEERVQEIPEAELVELLNNCQVWFIDSTHTVKSGSDCLYIYLKLMPQVTSRVLCHSHDIYLPYAPPPALALERNVFWTEQYLLHAYLLDNAKAQVLFGSAYVARQMGEQAGNMMRGRYPVGGASFGIN